MTQAKTEVSGVFFRTGEGDGSAEDGFVVVEELGFTAMEDAFLVLDLRDNSVANADAVSAYLRKHVKGARMVAFEGNPMFRNMR